MASGRPVTRGTIVEADSLSITWWPPGRTVESPRSVQNELDGSHSRSLQTAGLISKVPSYQINRFSKVCAFIAEAESSDGEGVWLLPERVETND